MSTIYYGQYTDAAFAQVKAMYNTLFGLWPLPSFLESPLYPFGWWNSANILEASIDYATRRPFASGDVLKLIETTFNLNSGGGVDKGNMPRN